MNQILITEKLYVTPELKRKRKLYKIEFVFSILLMLSLFSYYIYAQYDMNKAEEVSKDILSEIEFKEPEKITDDTTIKVSDNDVIVVALEYNQQVQVEEIKVDELLEKEKDVPLEVQTSSAGYKYTTIGTITIPKINVNYPILSGQTKSLEETENLLKNSPCEFWGSGLNEVGNFCIVGHNYRNTRFFSKVPTLVNGDIIEIKDVSKGRTIQYAVYDKFTIDPDTQDRSFTTQLTDGKKEITLITCTDDSKSRVVVKAREVK